MCRNQHLGRIYVCKYIYFEGGWSTVVQLSTRGMKKALRLYLQPQTALMRPMINKPFPAADFNIKIPIVILTKGKGSIN